MKYVFVGAGIGVPGLPHEISDQEAEQLGVTKVLKAAIENGSYKAVVGQSGKQKAENRQQKAESEE